MQIENSDNTLKEFKSLDLSKKNKKMNRTGINMPVITTSEFIPKKVIIKKCLIPNFFYIRLNKQDKVK